MIREILSFGAVALGGGYLVKRYWDKKKEGKTQFERHTIFMVQFYHLEASCAETHKVLANLAEKICALGDFGESLELLKSYSMSNEKYGLRDFIVLGKNEEHKDTFITQAGIMIECLSAIRMNLIYKKEWLDEIAQSLGKSRESSGKSLSAQTKSEIVALVEIMQKIYALITEDFVRETKFRYDKLVEAKNVINALKSHPSKSSANQN